MERGTENLLSSCGHVNVNVFTAGGFRDSESNDASGGGND